MPGYRRNRKRGSMVKNGSKRQCLKEQVIKITSRHITLKHSWKTQDCLHMMKIKVRLSDTGYPRMWVKRVRTGAGPLTIPSVCRTEKKRNSNDSEK